MSAGALIIGASQAGVQVAVSMRDAGYEEPIVLVGAEVNAPYSRPPLSKAFLAGKADADSLSLRTPAFYADKRIELVTSERVVELSLSDNAGGGGTATTDRGRSLEFDRLALTVGARTRRLDLPGADLTGVCYLRTIEDAAALRRHLAAASNVVVIGGGFIGLEAAAVARGEGKSVTVVEAAERLIPRSVAPMMSDFYREAHTRRGTEVRLGVGVSSIDGDASGVVTGVRLTDGTRIPAELVVVGIGIVPRTELAEQVGIACEGGILVDEFARTSVPTIVAAGDCTVLPHPLTGEGRFRLESMQNASNQATVAAATLVGKPVAYSAVPWFWSDQYDLKLQIAGLSAGYDQHVVRGDPDGESFSVLYYRQGRLLAIDAVNRAPDYLAARVALSRGAEIPAGRAVDAATPLKSLIVAAAALDEPA